MRQGEIEGRALPERQSRAHQRTPLEEMVRLHPFLEGRFDSGSVTEVRY
jgi:hypothetical protein